MSGIIEKMKDVLHVGHKEEGKHEECNNKAEHGGGDGQDSKGLMNKIKKKLGDRRCRRGGKGRRQQGEKYKEGKEEKESKEGEEEEEEEESESESESESDGGSD